MTSAAVATDSASPLPRARRQAGARAGSAAALEAVAVTAAALRASSAALEQRRDRAVGAAIAAGATWTQIGEALGVSPQAAALKPLVKSDFDMTRVGRQPEGRTLGHAFTFPRYRLGLPPEVPMVPVFINTYYPPNVPTARRCYELGGVVRQAIESWDSDARVAIIASGGLSHFVVDEELDRLVLAGIERDDPAVLGSLTRRQLRSGTSEILNWIAAAGSLGGLRADVIDYVPGYRTPAGTGAGMAFVSWGQE